MSSGEVDIAAVTKSTRLTLIFHLVSLCLARNMTMTGNNQQHKTTQVERGRDNPVLRTEEQRRLVLAVRGRVHGGTGAGADERRDERPPLLHALAPLVPEVEGETPGAYMWPVTSVCCWLPEAVHQRIEHLLPLAGRGHVKMLNK